MEKIWYIRFGSIQEGPYSVRDLKRDPRVKPDCLVWRKGFTKWVPIRQVRELKVVFEDDEPKEEEEENKDLPATRFQIDELILDMRQEPPHFYYWYIFILLALLAVLLQWALM